MSSGGRYLKKTPGKKKNKALMTILVVVLALVLIIGLLAGFVISKMNKIQRAEKSENSLTAEDLQGLMVEESEPTTEATTAPTETTAPKETAPDYGKTGKVVNVLLIGQDARPGEDSKNSDTMILCTVNKETKTLTLTSFLRDTFVYIPTFTDTYGTPHSGRTKMTLCYALGYKWGGDLGAMELMDMVIERNLMWRSIWMPSTPLSMPSAVSMWSWMPMRRSI